MPEPLLSVENLTIAYRTPRGETQVVRDLTFTIGEGEFVGLVGESGSGKTSVALALFDYLSRGGRIVTGDIRYRTSSLLGMARRELQKIHGRRIANVAQDPTSALNPALRIGVQLKEGMERHLNLPADQIHRRALSLLDEVHLPHGERLLNSYPHQLSGGMQQRVCIAMALSCDPELIVMDEPTTGLDAGTEAAVFDLLRELRTHRKLSVLLISHNLAAVRGMADRAVIMYGGRCMESGPTAEVFERPLHRYTQLLLQSLPTMRGPRISDVEMPWQAAAVPREGCPFRDRCDLVVPECGGVDNPIEVASGRFSACVRWYDLVPPTEGTRMRHPAILGGDAGALMSTQIVQTAGAPLVAVRELAHRYRNSLLSARSRHTHWSLDRVSFELRKGEVLAIIGESGSGKTTLARCIVGLTRPVSGSIMVGATEVASLSRRPLSVARDLQIVFQNIAGSLHPRKRIRTILDRPFLLYERKHASDEQLVDLAHSVGLRTDILDKLSARLSGGERQRSALARAFAPRPAVIVLDEAFSALDVSMKMKVRNLLQRKKAELSASYLLISHDLPLVRSMADRVLVLFRGWMCESGPRQLVEAPPFHPYTETLVWSALALESCVPSTLKPNRAALESTSESGGGCPYQARCPRKLGPICESEKPPRQAAGPDHTIECHIPIRELTALQRAEWPRDHFAEVIH